jgi:hypothetical protein
VEVIWAAEVIYVPILQPVMPIMTPSSTQSEATSVKHRKITEHPVRAWGSFLQRVSIYKYSSGTVSSETRSR